MPALRRPLARRRPTDCGDGQRATRTRGMWWTGGLSRVFLLSERPPRCLLPTMLSPPEGGRRRCARYRRRRRRDVPGQSRGLRSRRLPACCLNPGAPPGNTVTGCESRRPRLSLHGDHGDPSRCIRRPTSLQPATRPDQHGDPRSGLRRQTRLYARQRLVRLLVEGPSCSRLPLAGTNGDCGEELR
jgi:hypothetical protein